MYGIIQRQILGVFNVIFSHLQNNYEHISHNYTGFHYFVLNIASMPLLKGHSDACDFLLDESLSQ